MFLGKLSLILGTTWILFFFTGNYRGPAHSWCNINFNLSNLKIPVVLHNFKGYDSKLILRDIGRVGNEVTEKLSVLAENSEKFKSISFEHCQFIDSMAHLSCSLATLTNNLVKDCKINDILDLTTARQKFHHLALAFPNDEQFTLLLRKGVFPYTWFDVPDKLNAIELPARSEFHNDLDDEDCSEKDYIHAKKVSNTVDSILKRKQRGVEVRNTTYNTNIIFQSTGLVFFSNVNL